MDNNTNILLASNDEILIYQSQDGIIKIDVLFENETVWLNQSQLCVLFGKSKSTVSEHIKHIFEEGELDEKAVVRNFRTTASDGKTYQVDYYNLDVIISVGYRVKSLQGTQFRQWATQRLRDYIIKGVALNDERFKRGNSMNYFKDLLERIREIRLSERVFYQQIKDIYATSIDYNPNDELTLQFFKEVQNKLLWAVSGKAQALAHTPMYMKDWIEHLKMVLTMNKKSILEDAGRISHQIALQKAENEYTKYKRQLQAAEHLESIKELNEDLKRLQK